MSNLSLFFNHNDVHCHFYYREYFSLKILIYLRATIDNKGKLGNWLFCFQLFAVEYQGLSQKP